MKKSDNPGFKATFIQMGRRDRDVERHREVRRQEWVVPHPQVVDKNWEEYIGREGSQSQTRSLSPGFQHQEDVSITSVSKN